MTHPRIGARINHCRVGLATIVDIVDQGETFVLSVDSGRGEHYRYRASREFFTVIAPRSICEPPQRYGPYKPIAKALP
jgi:hypothetical protein